MICLRREREVGSIAENPEPEDLMLTRDQIHCLRRVVAAAAWATPGPATDPELTEAELIVDDLEAAVDAYEVWLDERADAVDRDAPEPAAAVPW